MCYLFTATPATGRTSHARHCLPQVERCRARLRFYLPPQYVLDLDSLAPNFLFLPAFDTRITHISPLLAEVDLELSPDISFTSFCVRLFELGCDFSVLGMADFATDEMGNYLSLALQMINDQRLSRRKVLPSGRTVIQDRLRENNFMSLFLLGVEAADAIRLHAGHENRIRPFQMLVDFFIAGKEILLAEPEMELFLDDDVVPAFARAVLLTERRGGARSKWMKNLVARPPAVVKGRSGLCCACGRGLKNISETGGPGLVNPRSRIVTYAQVCCASCSDKEKNVGEHGLVKWEVFDPEKE